MPQQISSANLQARLDEFAARARAETGVPGIALGVSVAGEHFYACVGTNAASEGRPLTRESRFHLGCAGKLLLAIATLELERLGKVDISAAIGEYLPELRGSLHGDAVRLSHLLSHTSGYRGTNILDQRTRALTWQGLVGYLRMTERLFGPGSVFSYEHTETVLLGEILRRTTGATCDRLIHEAILCPLGVALPADTMTADRHDAGRHRLDPAENRFVALDSVAIPPFWRAAFSDRTVSLVDLLRIAEGAIGERKDSSGVPLVSATARRDLQRTVVRLPKTAGGPLRELLPVAFGLGAAELRDGSHGNTGVSAGQCLGIRFDERTRIGVVVGLNAMVPYLRDFILTTICRDLLGGSGRDESDPFLFDLAELEGDYAGPGGGIVEVRFDEERLICSIGRECTQDKLSVELALDDDNRPVLRSPLPYLSLGFFREPGGDAALMIGLGAYKRRSTNRPFQR